MLLIIDNFIYLLYNSKYICAKGGIIMKYTFNDKDQLIHLVLQPIYMGINSFHILWLIFMLIMLSHLFPKDSLSMALLKKVEKK